MDYFFIACTHFGHGGALRFRPQFASVHEMDEVMIDNWNRVVRPRDVVFHLGDFMWPKEDPRIYTRRLNGAIRFVRGNHDHGRWPTTAGTPFSTIDDILVVRKLRVVLCHYPMLSWPQRHYGYRHFFGHVHDSPVRVFGSCCVCVEKTDYAPLPYEEAFMRAGLEGTI